MTKDKGTILSDFKWFIYLWPYIRPNRRAVLVSVFTIPIISLSKLVLPLILKMGIDDAIKTSDLGLIFYYSSLIAGVVVIDYASNVVRAISAVKVIQGAIIRLRRRLLSHLISLRLRFHDTLPSGALVTRATADFENLSESLGEGVLQSLVDIVILIGCLIGMFLLSWRLSLATLILLPLSYGLIGRFSKVIKTASFEAKRHLANLNGFTQECLFGLRTIKTLKGENTAIVKHKTLREQYRQSQFKSVSYDALLYSTLDGLSFISVALILGLSIYLNESKTTVTIGTTIAFVRYVQQLFEPLKRLGSMMTMLQGAFTSLERIFSLLTVREFIEGSAPLQNFSGEVKVSSLTFSYVPGEENQAQSKDHVLNKVSFHLPAGTTLGIVGTTGSGKSSLAKILTKQYDSYSGSIYFDNQNLKEISPDSLEGIVSIVNQEIVLFQDTILNNITLGRSNIDEKQAIEAAKTVNAHEFICDLPNRYQFVVAEGGQNLSLGQQQLISFARALASNPQLIILDEATSSIDAKTEAKIQQARKSLLSDRSGIIIAHRLSTIQDCTNIVVLEGGRIIEQGSHDELLKQNGAYKHLHQTSKKEKLTDSPARFPFQD